MPKHLIYFHSADFDGICGGKIIEKWVLEKYNAQPEMRPINYNENPAFPEDLENYCVYMVDFSLDPEYMLYIKSYAQNFIWCDHHITAIKNSEDFGYTDIKGLRSVSHAGCELAWMYFFEDTPMPYPVKLVGRYDVWDHSNPDALYFQYGARYMLGKSDRDTFWKHMLSGVQATPGASASMTLNLSSETDPEATMTFLEAISTGKVIYDYQTSSDEKAAKSICYEVEFEGLKFIAANRSHINSNFFNSVYDPSVHDGMIRFNKLKDADQWSVSLYTAGDVDLSVIAKKYGGGGHKQACGFQISTEQLSLLTLK